MNRFAISVCAALLLSAFAGSTARADWNPSGSLSALALVERSDPRNIGGAVLLDLWKDFGYFTLGGAAGIGILASDDANASRVFTPLAAQIGLRLRAAPVGFHVMLRGGVWGGAEAGGLQGGALVGGAARIEFAFDPRLYVTVGVDIWKLTGQRDALVFSPSLGLTWSP